MLPAADRSAMPTPATMRQARTAWTTTRAPASSKEAQPVSRATLTRGNPLPALAASLTTPTPATGSLTPRTIPTRRTTEMFTNTIRHQVGSSTPTADGRSPRRASTVRRWIAWPPRHAARDRHAGVTSALVDGVVIPAAAAGPIAPRRRRGGGGRSFGGGGGLQAVTSGARQRNRLVCSRYFASSKNRRPSTDTASFSFDHCFTVMLSAILLYSSRETMWLFQQLVFTGVRAVLAMMRSAVAPSSAGQAHQLRFRSRIQIQWLVGLGRVRPSRTPLATAAALSLNSAVAVGGFLPELVRTLRLGGCSRYRTIAATATVDASKIVCMRITVGCELRVPG